MTNESPLFLRLRTIAFCCVNFVSFLWVVLYTIVIFSQWDLMDRSERSLVAVMLIVNVITFLTFLILLLVEFRVWLDIARVCFLLVAQTGTAGAFVHWRPQFRCEENLGDQQGVCDMISLYILLTSWVVPALLLVYLFGLALRSYRYHGAHSNGLTLDVEKGGPILKDGLHSARPSLLPIMTAFPTPASLAFPPEVHGKPGLSVNTKRSTMSMYSKNSSPPATPFASSSPGRLSKRSPLVDVA